MNIIFIFLFGLIIGSFLNALSFRYNSGKSMLGRSMCFSCSHTLKAVDLIPVFSFLWLRARCRYCRSKISYQYPFVELLTGLLFVFIYSATWAGSLFFIFLHFIFWSSFLFITLYDLKHKIVPDEAVYVMALAGLLRIVVYPSVSLWINLLFAVGIFLPFFLIWFLSRGRLIGLGDGKIILTIGLFMPISAAISGVFLSFWIGSAYAFLVLLLNKIGLNLGNKKLTMKSELAFVPFLFLGSFISWLLSLDILGLSLW